MNNTEINELLYAVIADNLDNLSEVLDKLHESRSGRN